MNKHRDRIMFLAPGQKRRALDQAWIGYNQARDKAQRQIYNQVWGQVWSQASWQIQAQFRDDAHE